MIEDEADVDAAWEAELIRRGQAIKAGRATGQPAEQVFDELREKHRQKLLDKVDEGTRQLRSGEFASYDDEALLKFRDQIKADGLKRLESNGGD